MSKCQHVSHKIMELREFCDVLNPCKAALLACLLQGKAVTLQTVVGCHPPTLVSVVINIYWDSFLELFLKCAKKSVASLSDQDR